MRALACPAESNAALAFAYETADEERSRNLRCVNAGVDRYILPGVSDDATRASAACGDCSRVGKALDRSVRVIRDRTREAAHALAGAGNGSAVRATLRSNGAQRVTDDAADSVRPGNRSRIGARIDRGSQIARADDTADVAAAARDAAARHGAGRNTQRAATILFRITENTAHVRTAVDRAVRMGARSQIDLDSVIIEILPADDAARVVSPIAAVSDRGATLAIGNIEGRSAGIIRPIPNRADATADACAFPDNLTVVIKIGNRFRSATRSNSPDDAADPTIPRNGADV